MARKKVYIGSTGPYLYDDATLIDDPDGDFAGHNNYAIITDDQLLVERAPAIGDEVVRLADLPIGDVDITFADMTAFRVLGTSYQNTNSGMLIVQISVRLEL